MSNDYLLHVQVFTETDGARALDWLTNWFKVDRPDAFLDCWPDNPHVWTDSAGQSWACVGFPAAEDEVAEFMASLAVQECGLNERSYRLSQVVKRS